MFHVEHPPQPRRPSGPDVPRGTFPACPLSLTGEMFHVEHQDAPQPGATAAVECSTWNIGSAAVGTDRYGGCSTWNIRRSWVELPGSMGPHGERRWKASRVWAGD